MGYDHLQLRQEIRQDHAAYYETQKKVLRPDTYLRLHENKWATAEESFITPEMWDSCVNASHHPTKISRDALYVGVDVGISRPIEPKSNRKQF